MSGNHVGTPRPKTKEWKKNMSLCKSGSGNPNFGKRRTEEWKLQHSIKMKQWAFDRKVNVK